ncbi:MAG: protein-tyrosine-phosphatase [Bacteroidetes bacterium HGW-Bacteroidetes-23]|nr:MAG: protein-tyrosine-phosphatase [Bacteroidetes bacterium HGW-Bacteroidetes-23]
MTRILFVCLGNICRSPSAEGVFASRLQQSALAQQVQIDSAGTGHWHVGNPPDKRSILTAEKNGIDITNQRGKLFKPSFFKEYDYIYVMDTNNYADVIKMAKNEDEKMKVQLILDELFPGENVDVPDPYQGIQSNFDQVFEMLDEACDSIANKLLEKK